LGDALHNSNQLFKNPGYGHSGKIRAPRRGCSDRPSRIKSCAGLPITVMVEVTNLNRDATFPSASGPRFPTWQSPQIQIGGPVGT
jgi:hypothetical protein